MEPHNRATREKWKYESESFNQATRRATREKWKYESESFNQATRPVLNPNPGNPRLAY